MLLNKSICQKTSLVSFFFSSSSLSFSVESSSESESESDSSPIEKFGPHDQNNFLQLQVQYNKG